MPIYATLISANQINTEQMTGTSSLAVSASYSEVTAYAQNSGNSISSSYSLTASFALNSSSVNTGSFILTSSIYKQEISGDLGVNNLSATGSGSFDSVIVGTQLNGMFRLRTSGSGIDDMALTIEFFSGSWIECGYFKK